MQRMQREGSVHECTWGKTKHVCTLVGLPCACPCQESDAHHTPTPAPLQRARYGVVSMCTGAGMGAAAVFESGSSMDSTGSSLGSLNSIDTLCKGECLGANGQANGQQAEGANGKTD